MPVMVRQWMTTQVVTTTREASVQEALALMKKYSIRHLPVVDAQHSLQGWVTDADLRAVLIASMLEELTLEDVMVRKPYTTTPDTALEQAARLILDKRIGGLPVLEDGKLVGIITVVDILSAFINIMGMLLDSSRVDVKVAANRAPLETITRLIQQHHGEVISICHVPALESRHRVYSIRLKKCDLNPIVSDLTKNGIQVVSTLG